MISFVELITSAFYFPETVEIIEIIHHLLIFLLSSLSCFYFYVIIVMVEKRPS